MSCKHLQTKKHFKADTRFDKQIVIRWEECECCHEILHGGVTLVEPVIFSKSVKIEPAMLEGKLIKVPEVTLEVTDDPKIDLAENPGQKNFETATGIIESPKIKPIEPAKIPNKTTLAAMDDVENKKNLSTNLREANDLEENEPDDPENPFSDKDPDEEPEKPAPRQTFGEGDVFLKESPASIKKRRNALKRRRERAKLAAQKKAGGLNPNIPFLDEPERPSKEDEYN